MVSFKEFREKVINILIEFAEQNSEKLVWISNDHTTFEEVKDISGILVK
ncbi:hypothetical protein [Vallitalea okinawensis]|nr:hypothetical protein [Vallitalea okinawensis]